MTYPLRITVIQETSKMSEFADLKIRVTYFGTDRGTSDSGKYYMEIHLELETHDICTIRKRLEY